MIQIAANREHPLYPLCPLSVLKADTLTGGRRPTASATSTASAPSATSADIATSAAITITSVVIVVVILVITVTSRAGIEGSSR